MGKVIIGFALALTIFGALSAFTSYVDETAYSSAHPESTLSPVIEQLAFSVLVLGIGCILSLVIAWKAARKP